MDLHRRDEVGAPIIEDFNGQTVDGAMNGGATTIMENQAQNYGVPPAGVEPSGVNTNGGAPSYVAAPMQQQQNQQQHNNGMQPSYQQQQQPAPAYDPSVPPSELFELEDRFIIFLDMPGLDRESINVKYDHPHISISANRPSVIDNMKNEHGNKLIQNSAKKYYGDLHASFGINKNIETVSAKYNDGVLEITALFKQKGEISITIE
jgi:HSP20 family molecular chaperone IbpA